MLEPPLFPFAVAFALLFLLAAMQVLGIGDLFGDGDVDGGLDADGDGDAGAMGGIASIIGLGRLPLLVWLALLLFLFAGIGFSGQLFLENLTGAMLSPYLAGPAALLAALPATGIAARLLGPIIPRDETTAISRAQLMGKRGILDVGTARRGSPARAIVRDRHGQPHNVMVEPHDDDAQIASGDRILLVRREGDLFYATSEDDRRLGPVR